MMGSIEETEESHEPSTAIRRHDRHKVHVVAKSLYARGKHGVGPLDARRGLTHEVANGSLKRQSAAQRAEELSATAVTLQDFILHDGGGSVPVLKLLHGIGQGELKRQGVSGTNHDVVNR
jgi:hypothetical protein